MNRAMLAAAWLLVPVALAAQEPPRQQTPEEQELARQHERQMQEEHGREMTMRQYEEQLRLHLFAPDLLMQHQDELGLSTQQRQRFQELVHALQERVVSLQGELQTENRRLLALVEADEVNVPQALEQFARVLAIEQQVKTRHFETLLALRNSLTPAQRARMNDLLTHTQQHLRQEQIGALPLPSMPHWDGAVDHAAATTHRGIMPPHVDGAVLHHEGGATPDP